MTEAIQPSDQPIHSLPNPQAIDAIRTRLEGKISVQTLHLLPNSEPTNRGSLRSDQILSTDIPEEAKIIDDTISNSIQLKDWMDSNGAKVYDDEFYRLSQQESIRTTNIAVRDGKTIELNITDEKFKMKYILYKNEDFELNIEFPKTESEHVPTYRTGRKPIRTDLTPEEAQIINFYALGFLKYRRSLIWWKDKPQRSTLS